MISPYYNRPTQEGIYQHYKKVASEVGISLIVYNIPGRTGSKIEPETLARLAEITNVAGVKEATGSVDQAIDVIRLCGDGLAVYSGEDSLIYSLMSLGGKGVISTCANVAPLPPKELYARLITIAGIAIYAMHLSKISNVTERKKLQEKSRALLHKEILDRTRIEEEPDQV